MAATAVRPRARRRDLAPAGVCVEREGVVGRFHLVTETLRQFEEPDQIE
jgi:hypothetical protein